MGKRQVCRKELYTQHAGHSSYQVVWQNLKKKRWDDCFSCPCNLMNWGNLCTQTGNIRSYTLYSMRCAWKKALFQRVKAKVGRNSEHISKLMANHGPLNSFSLGLSQKCIYKMLFIPYVRYSIWLRMAETFERIKKSIENLIQWLQTCLALMWMIVCKSVVPNFSYLQKKNKNTKKLTGQTGLILEQINKVPFPLFSF